MNEEVMTYNASDRFLVCPFCGGHDNLIIKRTSKYIQTIQCMEYSFSIRCKKCDLTFGESPEGTQMYGTESELLSDWNRRRY